MFPRVGLLGSSLRKKDEGLRGPVSDCCEGSRRYLHLSDIRPRLRPTVNLAGSFSFERAACGLYTVGFVFASELCDYRQKQPRRPHLLSGLVAPLLPWPLFSVFSSSIGL